MGSLKNAAHVDTFQIGLIILHRWHQDLGPRHWLRKPGGRKTCSSPRSRGKMDRELDGAELQTFKFSSPRSMTKIIVLVKDYTREEQSEKVKIVKNCLFRRCGISKICRKILTKILNQFTMRCV